MWQQREPEGFMDKEDARQELARGGSGDYGSVLGNHEDPASVSIGKRMNRAAKLLSMRQVDALRTSPAANLALFIVMPWVIFSIVMCPFALGYRHFHVLAWLVLAFALTLSMGMIAAGKRAENHGMRTSWHYLGYLCLGASLLGAFLGLYDYFKYVTVYHIYEASRFYQNVLPLEDPGGLLDAGMFTFSSDTYVDPTRSVGYQVHGRYCVAPILSRNTATIATHGPLPVANFWAVGVDCCQRRGLFECGPVWDESAHAGLRVLDASPLQDKELPRYLTAVRQAAAAYGLNVPEDAILVKWTQSPEDLPQAFWDNGLRFYRHAVGIYIAVVLVLGLIAALYWDANRLRVPGAF
mmetsp:Transcript_135689/g.377965  ORF Transcript_135689/g.377965 Transcript_135689/m.377965 type:complete len:352 (-) Transcript_135689:90-1145(-)